MENNKNKKSVKFQGDMLNFCDFIQVFVFTRNHHLNKSYCDIKTEVKATKTLSTLCFLPRVNLYFFGKDPSIDSRDKVEFKVSKLVKIDTFSKRNILDKIV